MGETGRFTQTAVAWEKRAAGTWALTQALDATDRRTADPSGAPIFAFAADWAASWREDPFDTFVFFGLVAGLAWAPFWLGGDRPLPWGLNGVLFPSLTLAYELSLLARGRKHPFALKEIALPAALFGAVVIFIGIQISTFVPASFAHPIWSMAGEGLDKPLRATISVDPQKSALALMRLLTDASVFWLSMELCRAPRRALLMLQALAAIVAAYAAYGLVLSAFFGGAIPFFDPPQHDFFVRSTFINRDNFATYAGLGLVAAAALTLRFYRQKVPGEKGIGPYRLSRLIHATGAHGFWRIGATIVILVALLGTVSRGGVIATSLGLVSLLVLTFARNGRGGGRRVETILFVAVALLAGFLFFGDRFLGRIAESGLTDANRSAVYKIVAKSVLDSPFLGFGYGTFSDVFPMYRDHSISPVGVWDMAHNTYLEVFQGLGLVFGGALILSLALLAWKILRGALSRQRDAAAPIVAFSAALLVGLHAMVDFSLQIEAVALTFMALIGAGVAQSASSRQITSD